MQNENLSHINVEGYKFYKIISLSQNGSVGLYIRNSLLSNS